MEGVQAACQWVRPHGLPGSSHGPVEVPQIATQVLRHLRRVVLQHHLRVDRQPVLPRPLHRRGGPLGGEGALDQAPHLGLHLLGQAQLGAGQSGVGDALGVAEDGAGILRVGEAPHDLARVEGALLAGPVELAPQQLRRVGLPEGRPGAGVDLAGAGLHQLGQRALPVEPAGHEVHGRTLGVGQGVAAEQGGQLLLGDGGHARALGDGQPGRLARGVLGDPRDAQPLGRRGVALVQQVLDGVAHHAHVALVCGPLPPEQAGVVPARLHPLARRQRGVAVRLAVQRLGPPEALPRPGRRPERGLVGRHVGQHALPDQRLVLRVGE